LRKSLSDSQAAKWGYSGNHKHYNNQEAAGKELQVIVSSEQHDANQLQALFSHGLWHANCLN
jgi:hypothetical protein